MSKWIVFAFIVIIGLVAVVLIMGSNLPALHRAVAQRVINAPVLLVYQRITAFEQAPQWRPTLHKVEVMSRDPVLRYIEHAGAEHIEYELVENRSPDFLRIRIASTDLPYSGEWSISLREEDAQTLVEVTEVGRVENPIFRFLSHHVFGHTASMSAYLDDLQRSFP